MKALYVDTSAALKQVRRESETDAYLDYLGEQVEGGTVLTSSLLLDVELARFAVREGLDHAERVAPVLAAFARRQISPAVVRGAAAIEVHVRGLDAIHLATAAQLGTDLVAVVTYDRQMRAAARALGLPVVAPGSVG
ncbi:type II toxin-antitoxin system VapC family toxin [Cellulosimicrobium marinum]|uniref:type II toxin-antitoxin system VapC family toxin n=1 Tax=Cellulosimicrobium marinum TaxID=1638992 RepID=UPI001E644703|nr:type II toxin-antitoxin system VapC family toxin [Cellulosimicrobium marinum]MCB7136114.1 type II toxin-antitoxin system VapC family toxin [Cellulosimicrobium marinum]